MEEFKLCSDGEFLPVSIPCPPAYSGPYYYYPYENIPLPPEESDYSASSSKGGGGASISSGAVAGIIITGGFLFFLLCLVALKCRARFILGYGRNARNHDQLLVSSEDNNMVVNIVGCGLEERLVNLLPVYEYMLQEGRMDGIKERQECAVCLSLFEEKETVRVLPKCHHVFHIHCIDKWFESHANCPLCRERITLQTIQLSLKCSKKPDHDQQLPSDPPLTPHPAQDQRSFNDQPANSSSSRDFCVHVDHQRLAGDLHPHQNIFFALPSAALNIKDPHTTNAAPDQPGATHAACGHLAADDQVSAEFTRRSTRASHCDHKNPSIPAAIPAECLRDAESKQDRSHTGATARQAINDDQVCCQGQKEASCKRGELFSPMLQPEARAGDHKTAPSARQCSRLRKSLSTGSMDIDQSNGNPSMLPLPAPARLARSSTRLFR